MTVDLQSDAAYTLTPAIRSNVANGRNRSLDFTKGILVLFMVLYHWLNYFVSTQGAFYRYLRFLPPSFIFITGFLVSNVYLCRYNVSDRQIERRLIVRGLKILAIFLGLNLCTAFLMHQVSRFQTHPVVLRSIVTVLAVGNSPTADRGAHAAFSVLVPIGYLLMLCAVLLTVSRICSIRFTRACLGTLLCSILLVLAGVNLANLEFLAFGLLGVASGMAPVQRINTVAEKGILPLLVAYGCYLFAITAGKGFFLLQACGVCLTLLLTYALGLHASGWGLAGEGIVQLGKYSLFGYISQIAILQVLRPIVSRVDSGHGMLAASFIAAFALTFLSIWAVASARGRFPAADRLYRVVFA